MDKYTMEEMKYKNGFNKGYQEGDERGKQDSVKHARWVKNWCDNNLIGHEYEECSACGCSMLDTNQFWDCNHCPNCGAKMDGGANA